MRDFYDIYALTGTQAHNINNDTLREALASTCEKRGSIALLKETDLILREISESMALTDLWQSYQRKFDYAAGIIWDDVMASVKRLIEICSQL